MAKNEVKGGNRVEPNHIKTLQKTFLFQDMSHEECIGLINCLSPQVKRFSKNEIILLAGDAVEHIGIILCGTAHAHLEHINGSHIIMSTLAPTSVFGEVLASTRTHKSPVTIQTKTDVTAAFIEYQKVYSMCEIACAAHRIFMQNMLKTLGDKCFDLFDRINILREKTLRAKILTYLYGLSDSGKTDAITIPFSKTMLADYLSANRSALSKELRKMEADGLICVDKREIKLFW